MWLNRIVSVVGILSLASATMFAGEICLWTFGVETLPPWQALLRFGIWCVPLSLSAYWHFRQPLARDESE